MLFEVGLAGGSAQRRWRDDYGDMGEAFSWDSLKQGEYPEDLVETARLRWTRNALNEFVTCTVMGQLLMLMGQANIPLDLWSLAATFPREELLHVELCSRIAMQLGGGAPIAYDSDQLVYAIDSEQSPLEQCNEMVVRLLCVGEGFSLPMLYGSMQATTHPLVNSVLTRIVKDEVMHGRLGWLYMDWVQHELGSAERERLGAIAGEGITEYRALYRDLRSQEMVEGTPDGDALAFARELGGMTVADYSDLARKTIQTDIVERFEGYGIHVPSGAY
jgi:hypothetical protein